MSLREIALRVPDQPAPDANKCPSCDLCDAMAQQAFRDTEGYDGSKMTDVRVLRKRHVDSGECLYPDGAA
ncbi:hypothetical protein KV557_40750 [Kitasatospora aureofaciens]|uniref:hypothetical protein n=1 Tax=Kitasatospora aureofaciens TaxID=1894 RepID=UPI001C45189F|nr:hypothetical protein [Kitasatospora aureofaciens]MBV6703343.1 hypothetical protein [Kitasatospora aureofaciens]